jgi:glucose-1-phosphate cytidylyltransferase
MKVVLFCGGFGTRIREYSAALPKPMIPVDGFLMFWHIIQYYSSFGHNEFTLCLGYKASTIKGFFLKNMPAFFSDLVVSDHAEKVEVLGRPTDDWRITRIDTGIWRIICERLWAVHPARAR